MEPLFNIGDLVKIKNDFNPIVFIVVDSAEARTNVMYYNHVSGLFVTLIIHNDCLELAYNSL